MSVGILLVGHGTRQAAGQAEFLDLASQLAAHFAARSADEPARPAWIVEPCFLELALPTIEQGLARLIERQVRQVVVAPVLLFAAGHARRDIPAAVAETLRQYPGVESVQAAHLGCHPAMLDLAVARFRQACGETSPEQVLWLLVGRGSLDASATREMHEFAELASRQLPGVATEVCFVAMAQPSLTEGLKTAANSGRKTIVVQPHLLFAGDLLTQVEQAVAAARVEHPRLEWRLANRLGADPQVVAALAQRIDEAIRAGRLLG